MPVHHRTGWRYRSGCNSPFDDSGVRFIDGVFQQSGDRSSQSSQLHFSNQPFGPLFCLSIRWSFCHWLRRYTVHMYRGHQNHTCFEESLSREPLAARDSTFRQRRKWLSSHPSYNKYGLVFHHVSPATDQILDGNRVNQGIAEKLYTLAQGLSLLISSYAVALSVQWKLALITMTIMPATFVIYGTVIAYDIPIESRIVSVHIRCPSTVDRPTAGSLIVCRSRPTSTRTQQSLRKTP